MLTYAASNVHPQDLTASILSFKPKTFSLSRLALGSYGERKSSKGISLYTQKEAKFGTCSVVVAASLAAEAEVAEEVEEKEEGDVPTATAAPPKPKKGKAALPLKRDRVRLRFSILVFVEFRFMVIFVIRLLYLIFSLLE